MVRTRGQLPDGEGVSNCASHEGFISKTLTSSWSSAPETPATPLAPDRRAGPIFLHRRQADGPGTGRWRELASSCLVERPHPAFGLGIWVMLAPSPEGGSTCSSSVWEKRWRRIGIVFSLNVRWVSPGEPSGPGLSVLGGSSLQSHLLPGHWFV